jgi:drug/metabolite transporter (DMT)-like permease
LLLLVLVCVGFLDVGCYALYNIGFAWCGSALATIVLAASGQIATAVLSVLLLKRQLRMRHLAAVSIVIVGLVLRSMDDILAGNLGAKSVDSDQGSKQAYGALLVVVSALLFSILGVIYEMRSEGPNKNMSQAQVSKGGSGAAGVYLCGHGRTVCTTVGSCCGAA